MKRAFAVLAAVTVTASIPSASWAATDGKNRRVTVENVANQSIYYLYASPATSTTWEEDLLGSGTIPSGESKVANIDNGTNECYYDLKVVMADGREHIQRRVNVCSVSRWVIGESGNSVQ
jgi:hypothetical protein